jgi:hypothetical protein
MGDHKSKQGFLLIGKSGKRLETCERAEWEEEKMGEQGRGKMLAWEWGDLTRELEAGKKRSGKKLGGRRRKRKGCGPAGGHASPQS